ncbi:hypothetical protein D0Y65_043349 [Glycine soja]|uniref:Uncharacterized protein n=1 Tax=Glycine soja TaxID=3848 RepID=A0A445GH83_GLYSO|nr:hypothetical protein D0Y65_043349 [Glycine soja]
MEETEIDMLPVWVKLNFSKRIMGRVSEVMVRVLISVVEGEGSMTELGSKRMLKVHKSLSGEEGLESLGTSRMVQQCFLLTSGMSRNFTDYATMLPFDFRHATEIHGLSNDGCQVHLEHFGSWVAYGRSNWAASSSTLLKNGFRGFRNASIISENPGMKSLRGKEIALVKVQWGPDEGDSTWEVEDRKTGRDDGESSLRVTCENGSDIAMAAQLIHDRVVMECLKGVWETLKGNERYRFLGTIRLTATSLVHPEEPAHTLQQPVEWILPTPTPYRLVEPVQVIEVYPYKNQKSKPKSLY